MRILTSLLPSNPPTYIGTALKYLHPNATPPVPWHRVVASNGTISSRGPGTDGAARQRDALAAEGVAVVATRGGELRVDFAQCGWFPAPGTVDIGVPPAPDAHDDEESDEEGGEDQEDE